MKTQTKLLLLFFSLLLFPTAQAAAHPADVYAHTIHVTLTPAGMNIQWEIKPGPMLTSFLWHEADADQNDILTQQEIDDWGRARAALLTATLDDKPFPLLIESVQMPADLKNFQAGLEFITFNLSAKWPQDSANVQRLILDNGLEPTKSINWYYLSTEENTAFLFPSQKNHTIAIDVIQNKTLAGSQNKLLTAWDSGTPSLPLGQQNDVVTETAQEVVPELSERTPQEILLDIVRAKEFSISFYVFALGISFALGALHALTPGHGKTVVAAYLVGSRGTAWHAVVLGSVVTLTHTGSVFLLGIITLAASQYILPTTIIPWLEVLSGLMIVGLGLYLLWQRFIAWRNASAQEISTRKISLTPAPTSPKKISGAVKIQKADASLHHHGDGKLHSHEVPETITWRSLITLGISGGLVPCPDAIAILLVAIAINRILLGLALIVFFSLGLAVVLIVIGLLMVSSSRLFKRMDSFNRFAPFMPIVSAVIVLALGFGLTYGAFTRLGSGSALSLTGSSMSVDDAQVVYLHDDANEYKQLFLIDTQGGDPRKLTDAAKGVVDYAVSPDQSRIVFVEQTGELGYALWLTDLSGTVSKLIFACDDVICSQPIFSPDGRHIVFEHMPLDGGASSLWWYDTSTGQVQPVFQEALLPGTNPRWSPNGLWLSYATPDGIRLSQLESGESRVIPNVLGAAAQWSPDSRSILLRDVVIRHDQFVTQLFLYDLGSGSLVDLSENESMENILAAWSPDGRQIAVVRRDLSVPRGDQIWLMQADGSDPRAITDTPAVLHGSLSWSPDGKYILHDLYLLDSFPLESRLEMIEVKSGEITDLNAPGYNPKWIWLP
ncbi:MAG: PD40 domain-containing protein [Anaerolineales bacterium]|nr:PD40 domain-containing protein [Anaerolineales bacterium]